jgi:hypothetical protein
VQNLSPRAVRLYLVRLDDLWASLFPASLPPAPGLNAGSCSCGRGFVTRFFQLRLAATPCGSLRLPSSVPVGSFHPTRFCPCRAHWGQRFGAAAELPLGAELYVNFGSAGLSPVTLPTASSTERIPQYLRRCPNEAPNGCAFHSRRMSPTTVISRTIPSTRTIPAIWKLGLLKTLSFLPIRFNVREY